MSFLFPRDNPFYGHKDKIRRILPIAESERLIADHLLLGKEFKGGISDAEYERWHQAGKIILSRIFNNREIPRQFDSIGFGTLSLSDSDQGEFSCPAEIFRKEIEFLEALKKKLKSYPPVKRAIR